MSVWTVAAVVGEKYKERPLVRFGACGVATLVSASRFTGRNHFLSDLLVGSAIGYGIGHYVYRARHDQNLDPHNGKTTTHAPSKFLPLIAPRYDPRVQTYGVFLAWRL